VEIVKIIVQSIGSSFASPSGKTYVRTKKNEAKRKADYSIAQFTAPTVPRAPVECLRGVLVLVVQ